MNGCGSQCGRWQFSALLDRLQTITVIDLGINHSLDVVKVLSHLERNLWISWQNYLHDPYERLEIQLSRPRIPCGDLFGLVNSAIWIAKETSLEVNKGEDRVHFVREFGRD